MMQFSNKKHINLYIAFHLIIKIMTVILSYKILINIGTREKNCKVSVFVGVLEIINKSKVY